MIIFSNFQAWQFSEAQNGFQIWKCSGILSVLIWLQSMDEKGQPMNTTMVAYKRNFQNRVYELLKAWTSFSFATAVRDINCSISLLSSHMPRQTVRPWSYQARIHILLLIVFTIAQHPSHWLRSVSPSSFSSLLDPINILLLTRPKIFSVRHICTIVDVRLSSWTSDHPFMNLDPSRDSDFSLSLAK